LVVPVVPEVPLVGVAVRMVAEVRSQWGLVAMVVEEPMIVQVEDSCNEGLVEVAVECSRMRQGRRVAVAVAAVPDGLVVVAVDVVAAAERVEPHAEG
jgi:hypothetical protein